MSYRSRVYRHRNAQASDEQKQQQPFFGKQNADQSTQSKSFFQAKLNVNEPGDKYEREADSVANSVVSKQTKTPVVQQKKISSIQKLSTPSEEEKPATNDARMREDKDIQQKPIQRMCSDCEKEKKDEVQKKDEPLNGNAKLNGIQKKEPLPEEEEKRVRKKEDPLKEKDEEKAGTRPLQKKSNAVDTSASSQISSQIENASGKGSIMSPKTQSEMSSSFGVDFSEVRIHNDNEATQMSHELQAQAFTHGKDIYFNSGKYNPEDPAGKFLLAHELTHVVQQNPAEEEIQRSVNPNRVSCNSYPRSYPIFTKIGTTDPLSVLSAADTRAIDLLTATIDELTSVRQRIQNGEAPEWPTFSDCLAQNLSVRMLIDPSSRASWVNTGPGTVHHVIRILSNLREVFQGGWMRYNCIGPDCEGDEAAYVYEGQGYLINLCENFWNNMDNDNRALTLIHELAHAYYHTEDRGFTGPGSSYCIEHFLASLNMIPVPAEYQNGCHFQDVTIC